MTPLLKVSGGAARMREYRARKKADEEIWKARANRHRLALFLEQHRFIPPDTEDRAVIAAGFQKLVELLCSDEAELLR